MWAELVLCSAVLFVDVTFGQVYDERYYPSPQENFQICGRRSRSYVCDPEGILNEDDAAQLDAELYKIVQDSRCPCSSYTCRKNPTGYRVGVAMIKRLSAEERQTDRYEHHHVDLRREEMRRRTVKMLDEAKRVAFRLHESWALGQCEEDVLIVYSQLDDVIYTVTGSVARMKLDDALVAEIALEARRENIENFAFRGVLRIVESYRYVFTNQYVAAPRIGPVRGGSMSAFHTSLHFYIPIILLFVNWIAKKL